MLQDEIKKVGEVMKKAVEYTAKEFDGIHTGKASPTMVENIMVEVYGSTMRLKEVAAITTPDANTIRVQPWDKGALKEIEKSIQAANIGINPSVMGEAVRCPIPPLSGERRRDLIKVCAEMAEQGKVRIRTIRREAMEVLKAAQKKGLITEDDLKRAEKEVQNLTDKSTAQIGKDLEDKEAELQKV